MQVRQRSVHAALPLFVAVLLLALPGAALFAQQNVQGLPRVSPKQVVTQTVGVTEVTVEYHRPIARDRALWGSLIPDGQVWRAGANENTVITFGDDVKVEGQDLAAGTYGLHLLPHGEMVEVIFSKNHTSWGSFSYDNTEDALRVKVKAKAAPHQEILQFRFDDLTLESGTLSLHWGERRVPVKIGVNTHELVLADLRNQLRSLPGFSWMGWASAARYCLQNGVHLEEGMEWADRALSMEENFQTLQVKAGLLDRTGQTEEALALLDKALPLGNEGQVNALGYQMLQRGDSERAIKVFAQNVKRHPESWNVYDSLGEAQAVHGHKEKAIANYKKALSMAPDAQKPRITDVLTNLSSD